MDEQIKNEKTLTNIKKMFMAEIADMPKEKKKMTVTAERCLYILNRPWHVRARRAATDILRICEYLHNNGRPISQSASVSSCEL